MPVSILHVGLPLDHPLIPEKDRPRLVARLKELRETMQQAGYVYEFFHLAPEQGIEALREHLLREPCDGVLIGGGIAADSAMSYRLEQIVNTSHDVLPRARVMFFNHAEPVRTTVGRWFPLPTLKSS